MSGLIGNEIESMQTNLGDLRKLAGWTVEQLGEKLGIKKQAVTNIEHYNTKTKKGTKLSQTQYIALRFLFETEAYGPDMKDKKVNNPALAKALRLIFDNVDEYKANEKINRENINALASIAYGSGVEVASAKSTSILPAVVTGVGIAALEGLAIGILNTTKKNKK